LALAGCGGGDENSTGTTASTGTTSSRSKAEFVKLANGICKRADLYRTPEIGEYVRDHENEDKSQTASIMAAFRAVVLTKISGEIEEIRALGVPKRDEQQVEEILSSLERAVAAPGNLTLKELHRSAELARSYGLDECTYP
jgi:hypothetical protein